MEQMFRALTRKYPTELFVYMDDILIATGEDLLRHRLIVHDVLDLLESESYFLRPSKCVFEQRRVEYLGVIVDGSRLMPDPTKVAGLRDWPRMLHSVTDVRRILGVLGYQRPFIPDYAHLARPLTELTKKNITFRWTDQCRQALDTLINILLDDPNLTQPDPSRPYYLYVDASDYASGAILTQRDDRGKHCAVGYHSKTFSPAEQNYAIHDKEFLAVIRGLETYRHLLSGTSEPVTVYTDHKNLEYYTHPQNITRRVARLIPRLADYNYVLVHIPGQSNKADALSRRPDLSPGHDDNSAVTVLPPAVFSRATTLSSLDDRTRANQLAHLPTLARWAKTFSLTLINDLYWYGDRLVVVDDLPLRRGVISLYHDSPTAGHPGISKTLWSINQDFWWPNMKQTVTDYIKGCTTCQSRKNNPTVPKPTPYPITSEAYTLPFTSVTMDFITKLPKSHTYDTILTITDTFSKASIFIPCNETIDTTNTALLYATYVLPHFGLPSRIISDRDPRFTATFSTELCRLLQVHQNISTAYHPQMDRQSERTNQRLEQYLRIFIDYHQNDWDKWLPLAQYTLNAWPHTVTKKTPFDLIMGYTPRVHQITRSHTLSPTLDQRLAHIVEARKEAVEALKRAQNITTPTRFNPYCIGDRVWLEGKNLSTTHPTAKLAPRRYGPFLVTAVISHTTYRLKLPPTWKIHNVFHASLLTPYRETIMNSAKYQEPPPDLINGQPEWEVEKVLGSRHRRNQLQYLVRWKGFSEAHDSWEPLSHLMADKLIAEFYDKNPQAIRTTTHSPTIQTITVHSNPMSQTFTTPTVDDDTVPLSSSNLSLADRFDTPPESIPLLDRISPVNTSTPSPPPRDDYERSLPLPHSKESSDDSDEEPPALEYPIHPTLQVPVHPELMDLPGAAITGRTGEYDHYNEGILNHSLYGKPIHLPDGSHQEPQFIRFVHDFMDHQHHVVATHELGQSDPHHLGDIPYGWDLVVAVLPGASHEDVDNDNLADILDEDLTTPTNAALYTINDPGLTADVDRLRHLTRVGETLLERRQELERDTINWVSRMTPVRNRLVGTRANSRLHPYLTGRALIADPQNENPQHRRRGTLTIIEALQLHADQPRDWNPRPWFHDEDTAGLPVRLLNRMTSCVYCGKASHTLRQCPNPHALCHNRLGCIIPTNHPNYGRNTFCPAADLHVTDDDGDYTNYVDADDD
jgi:hypothetical protein